MPITSISTPIPTMIRNAKNGIRAGGRCSDAPALFLWRRDGRGMGEVGNACGAALGKAAPQDLATPLGDEDGEDKTDVSRRKRGHRVESKSNASLIGPVIKPRLKDLPYGNFAPAP